MTQPSNEAADGVTNEFSSGEGRDQKPRSAARGTGGEVAATARIVDTAITTDITTDITTEDSTSNVNASVMTSLAAVGDASEGEIQAALECDVDSLDWVDVPGAADTVFNRVNVRIARSRRLEVCDAGSLPLMAGDEVVVEGPKGPVWGTVTQAPCRCLHDGCKVRKVLRRLTPTDERRARQLAKKEAEAFNVCNELIDRLALPMKLLDVEFQAGGNRGVFLFSSEGRVDFRALVRELAQRLRCRVEMRQIGVRDEARLVGAIGHCGRPLCCSTFLKGFSPVSIKMAKNQNLALNPEKVSGVCGRLMCCLVYEDDAYKVLKKGLPKAGKTISTPIGEAKVREVDILARRVRVLSSNGKIATFTMEELQESVALKNGDSAHVGDEPLGMLTGDQTGHEKNGSEPGRRTAEPGRRTTDAAASGVSSAAGAPAPEKDSSTAAVTVEAANYGPDKRGSFSEAQSASSGEAVGKSHGNAERGSKNERSEVTAKKRRPRNRRRRTSSAGGAKRSQSTVVPAATRRGTEPGGRTKTSPKADATSPESRKKRTVRGRASSNRHGTPMEQEVSAAGSPGDVVASDASAAPGGNKPKKRRRRRRPAKGAGSTQRSGDDGK